MNGIPTALRPKAAPARRRPPHPEGSAGLRPSKLLQPRLAADAVDRPRLLALLDRRPDAPLVLVSGPSGSGH